MVALLLSTIIPGVWGALGAFLVALGADSGITTNQHLQTVYLILGLTALVIGAVWRLAARFSKIEGRLDGFDVFMRMTAEIQKDTNKLVGGNPDEVVRTALKGIERRRQ